LGLGRHLKVVEGLCSHYSKARAAVDCHEFRQYSALAVADDDICRSASSVQRIALAHNITQSAASSIASKNRWPVCIEKAELITAADYRSCEISLNSSAQRTGLDAVPCTSTTGSSGTIGTHHQQSVADAGNFSAKRNPAISKSQIARPPIDRRALRSLQLKRRVAPPMETVEPDRPHRSPACLAPFPRRYAARRRKPQKSRHWNLGPRRNPLARRFGARTGIDRFELRGERPPTPAWR